LTVARILSRTQLGLTAPQVEVELHVGRGLPNFNIVGLPAPVVRESRERVRAALLNSGYEFPAGRITVNLAPVELQKQGGRFDLPIALGLLVASGQLPIPSRTFECYGELGLAGEVRPVSGLLIAALSARRAGHAVIIPSANHADIALARHPAALGAATLREAAARLVAKELTVPHESTEVAMMEAASAATAPPAFADVIGQHAAKRALVVAAAGGHSVLMVGPPGSGKSMLAARLPALLPPLTENEALEVAAIASVAGMRVEGAYTQRPFRAPHHTASANAIVGGGLHVRPGEISLAHHGVLFLDEMPEFDRRVLESLREPLETGTITIARASARLELPARFQLVAAMNPCPCGFSGDDRQQCRCTPARLQRYRERLSGPLLDRIDIRLHVPRVAARDLAADAGARAVFMPEDHDHCAQVRVARRRCEARSGAISARLSPGELQRCCELPPESRRLLRRSCERMALSGRGMHRLLAVSRTIADLAGSDAIEPNHLGEAIQLRRPLPQ
jgi:magnesium chelatase family protein